jgi:hypothetical protein
LSLITVAALAVVVPGAAAGLAEHASAGGRLLAYSVTREPNVSYSATLASGDRVYSRVPSALPAAHKETAEAVPRARVRFPELPTSNPWRLQATLPGTVIKDISFASPTVGYIAAELGKDCSFRFSLRNRDAIRGRADDKHGALCLVQHSP